MERQKATVTLINTIFSSHSRKSRKASYHLLWTWNKTTHPRPTESAPTTLFCRKASIKSPRLACSRSSSKSQILTISSTKAVQETYTTKPHTRARWPRNSCRYTERKLWSQLSPRISTTSNLHIIHPATPSRLTSLCKIHRYNCPIRPICA